ncbi:MAG: type II toxin-antitoxin system HicA family toxin [Pyrinomonadaceae bacterium]
MKRRELLKRLEKSGCILVRHGGKHDWYANPATRRSQPVPRHSEINETLAKSILKKLSSE